MKALKRGTVVIAVMALLLGMGVALPSLAQGRSKSSDDRSTLDLSAMSQRGGEDRESSDDDNRSSNKSKSRSDDDHDDDHGDRRGGSDHDDDDAMSNLHWSGTLCDGEPISIDFSLREDAVQVDNVSGPANRVEATDGGARVYFDHVGARVSLRSERGGDRQVRLDARRGRCAQATTTTMVAPAPAPAPGDTMVTQPPATQPPATQPPATQPPATTPPAQPQPTTPVTTIPTTVSTAPAKQVRYLTYNISGEGSIAIQFDEPSNRIKFWSFTPNGTACWYTYDGKSLGAKVKTDFTDNTSFQATVGASGVAATYQGATIAPNGNSTVAPASTKSSC